ncbi:hypothetical protein MMC22_000466 [Lobaria immixta]|nr:hypothetical protein [Lobaria immixta]
MGCECIGYGGHVLVCGTSRQPEIWRMISWCYFSCSCGENTLRIRDQPTVDLDEALEGKLGVDANGVVYLPKPRTPISHQPHSGNNPTGSTHTCSGTCTTVNHECNWASHGDCKCFAPPVSLFYWHQGDCGTRLPFKAERDLAQQRHSYYLNLTNEFASSNKATAPPGPLPDHAVQLASGLLPSPCNASYVSFACSDSPDGIVHEPPQNWLGALVPEGAKELPSVPKEFLSIHGGKEVKMQVLRPAVD